MQASQLEAPAQNSPAPRQYVALLAMVTFGEMLSPGSPPALHVLIPRTRDKLNAISHWAFSLDDNV